MTQIERRRQIVPEEGHSQQTSERGLDRIHLPASVRQDLDDYCDYLRNFYGIPADAPVFPPREAQSPVSTSQGMKPRATGRNDDKHPWRRT